MRTNNGDSPTAPAVARAGFPVLWTIVAFLVIAVSSVQKLPCLRGRVDTDVLATTQCYSDIPIFYLDRGLAAEFGWLGHLPEGFRDLEYPALINLFIEACAKLTHVVSGVPDDELARRADLTTAELFDLPGIAAEERTFFFVSCVGLLIAVLGATLIAWRAGWSLGDRACWLMLAPILVLTVTLNWDAIAVVAAAGALMAWHRGRWALFGMLVALGTAAKLFPLVLLASGVILALRVRSVRATVTMCGAFAVTFVAVNAPLYSSNADAWGEFWRTSADRAEGFGSAWIALRMAGVQLTADQLSLLLVVGMVAAWGAAALLTWRGVIAPTIEELTVAFLLLFLVLGKVYSPQYSLWVALGVLLVTRTHWLIGAVAAAETFHYVATWLYIRGFTTPATGVDKTYWSSIVIRIGVEVVVVLYIVRRARRRAVDQTVADEAALITVS